MRTRDELHNKLVGLLGSRNVHFQPATNTELKYPCIVYKLDKIDSKYADNKRYQSFKKYTITHIYQKYSHNLQETLLASFDFIDLINASSYDGLYHDVYTLYF